MRKKELVDLLNQMTLSEKLGQLTQITGEKFLDAESFSEVLETGPTFEDYELDSIHLHQIGSVLGSSTAKVNNKIQKNYLKKSRLKIPLLFMIDAIHGYKTIFPFPLALASTWNKEIIKDIAMHTANELRESAVHVNFSPMVDLSRDARWGRIMESFGEDPLLSGDLGKAMIEGYQQLDSQGKIGAKGVAASIKHFAGYGASTAGKDYSYVDMSMKEFFNFHLIPYEKSLEASPKFVMSSFNSFNGTPVTSSKFFLKELLRDYLKFDGILISDWGAVRELQNHGVARNDYESAEMALKAGLDIEMISTCFLKCGEEVVHKNPELLQDIDEAVMRILMLKNELGLFEKPYTEEVISNSKVLDYTGLNLARKSAEKSFVLLKNEQQVFPLKDDINKLVILGPYAKTNELLGFWECQGSFDDVINLKQGFNQVNPNIEIITVNNINDIPEEFDFILLTIGEDWDKSGEGHSSASIELADEQVELIRKVKSFDKPYAAIGFSGRPLALQNVIDDIPALLWCWYPGTCAGLAVANVVLGNVTPTGKLPVSFPRSSGQNPIHYNEYRSGRPALEETTYSSRYQDIEIGPLFPFGYGKKYHELNYYDINISNTKLDRNGKSCISMVIKNDSKWDIDETVLLFMKAEHSKEVRPSRELVNYQSIYIKSGDRVKVEFSIDYNTLSFLDSNLRTFVSNGNYHFYLNSLDNYIASLEYYNKEKKNEEDVEQFQEPIIVTSDGNS